MKGFCFIPITLMSFSYVANIFEEEEEKFHRARVLRLWTPTTIYVVGGTGEGGCWEGKWIVVD